MFWSREPLPPVLRFLRLLGALVSFAFAFYGYTYLIPEGNNFAIAWTALTFFIGAVNLWGFVIGR